MSLGANRIYHHQQRENSFRDGGGLGIVIDPFNSDQMNPASYDLRLGNKYMEYRKPIGGFEPVHTMQSIDKIEWTNWQNVGDLNPMILYPGKAVLGVTMEKIGIGPGIQCRLEGKSTIGRLFITPHVAAGFVDPGWQDVIGNDLWPIPRELTLEIVNIGPLTVKLRPGDLIGQITFDYVEGWNDDGPFSNLYRSKGRYGKDDMGIEAPKGFPKVGSFE